MTPLWRLGNGSSPTYVFFSLDVSLSKLTSIFRSIARPTQPHQEQLAIDAI